MVETLAGPDEGIVLIPSELIDDDEGQVFETLEEAEEALGTLPVVGPDGADDEVQGEDEEPE
jgi:hypothetical protein